MCTLIKKCNSCLFKSQKKMSAPSEMYEVAEVADLAGGGKVPLSQLRKCRKGKVHSENAAGRRTCQSPGMAKLRRELAEVQRVLQVVTAVPQCAAKEKEDAAEQLRLDAEERAAKAKGVKGPRELAAEEAKAAAGGSPQGGFSGGKRPLSTYNRFVRKFHQSHRSLKGKSFIRSAAKAWNRSKGGRMSRKTRSRSRSRKHHH